MATDSTTENLREMLEGERDSLRNQLDELGYGANGLDYDPNFADSSQVTAERGENETLVTKLVEGLHEVEHALEKFGSAAYGVCENCHKPIAPARLEARPEARLCIECAAATSGRR
jgi:RNA polymerase-binding transcription factor DksA